MSDTLHPSIVGLSHKLAEFTHSFHLTASPGVGFGECQAGDLGLSRSCGLGRTAGDRRATAKFCPANVGSGNCTVWGMAMQTNARDAALLNGTLAHGLDYDDRNHATTYTLASSIAVSESVDAGGREALEAFIAGREVRASLDSLFSHRSSGIGPGARGWHSNGILGPIAAACCASKLLKLDTKANSGGHRSCGRILRRAHARRRHHGKAFSLRPRGRNRRHRGAAGARRIYQR